MSMATDINGWEVIYREAKKRSFYEMVLSVLFGTDALASVAFTLRERATGRIETITALGEGELSDRIAKGQFDHVPGRVGAVHR
jgi:hypothetical protein